MFEEWCRVVRDCLLWLDCADPVELVKPQADDPTREQFSAVILGWQQVIGVGVQLPLRKVIEQAHDIKAREFRDALVTIMGPLMDVKKLGDYLRPRKLKVLHGYRLSVVEGKQDHRGSALWQLEKV